MFGIPKWFVLLLFFIGSCGFTAGLFQHLVGAALIGLVIAGWAGFVLWRAIPAPGTPSK